MFLEKSDQSLHQTEQLLKKWTDPSVCNILVFLLHELLSLAYIVP